MAGAPRIATDLPLERHRRDLVAANLSAAKRPVAPNDRQLKLLHYSRLPLAAKRWEKNSAPAAAIFAAKEAKNSGLFFAQM